MLILDYLQHRLSSALSSVFCSATLELQDLLLIMISVTSENNRFTFQKVSHISIPHNFPAYPLCVARISSYLAQLSALQGDAFRTSLFTREKNLKTLNTTATPRSRIMIIGPSSCKINAPTVTLH